MALMTLDQALPTLEAWYDPDDAATVTLGTGISALANKVSGGAFGALEQATGGSQPQLGTNRLNSTIDTIYYPSPSYNWIASVSGLSSGTYLQAFAIFRMESGAANYARGIAFNSNSGNADYITGYIPIIRESNLQAIQVGGGFGDYETIVYGDWYIVATILTATTIQTWVNGTMVDETTYSYPTFTPALFAIGNRADSSQGERWKGDIAVGAVATGLLTTDEIDDAFGVLAWSKGLEGLLPTGHPHKDAAPTTGGTDALTASSLTTGSPVLGTPTAGHIHVLTATALATGSPATGTPAIGQVHALAASALATSGPALGAPAVGQTHPLSATSLMTGSPVLGTPTLSDVDSVDDLIASALVVGSPVLGGPSLGQAHILVPAGLGVGSPVLGAPILDAGLWSPVAAGSATWTAAPAGSETWTPTAASSATWTPA